MSKVTFDGDKLLIIINPGVKNIEVGQDLYSDWKEWQLENDNFKYPPAFRTVGGDPLTPGISAGAYFFLQNDIGWRIKAPEENTTIFIAGNLAAEDSSVGVLVPSTGDFSVLIQGLQPITQSVESILLQSQDAAYQGQVAVDFQSNNTGVGYPIGTATNPVNNVQDAFTIANRLGIKTIKVSGGEFLLDRDAISYTFIGDSGGPVFDTNGFNVTGSKFHNFIINDTDFGNSEDIQIVECLVIGFISNFQGLMTDCGISRVITIKNGNIFTGVGFNNCYTLLSPISNATIDFNETDTNVTPRVTITNHSGELIVDNMNSTSGNEILHAGFSSGSIKFTETCTNGIATIEGIGDLKDLSKGTIINRKGFIETEDITQLREYIYFNSIDGEAGTNEGIGTVNRPVNNVADAFTLAERYGFKKFKIEGEFILDRNTDNIVFEGTVSQSSAKINLNGFTVHDARFNQVEITGNGNNSARVYARFCRLNNLSGISGIFKDCGLESIFLPGNNTLTEFLDCYSEALGNALPILDLGDTMDSDTQIRDWVGGLEIRNCDVATQKVSIDLSSGRVALDPSNTAGTIVVRGSGYIEDHSTGTTVITKGLLGNAINTAAYNSEVLVDVTNGSSGQDYPIGLPDKPVNNLADAKVIAQLFGLSTFKIKGLLTVNPGEDISNYNVIGDNPISSVVLLAEGAIASRTKFSSMILAGTLNGPVYAEKVALDNLKNIGDNFFPSVFESCILRKGTFTFNNSLTQIQNIQFANCISGDPTLNSPILNVNDSLNALSIRDYQGGLVIQNYTQGQESNIQMTGQLTLESSCTNGKIDVKGVGLVSNQSTGSFILEDGGFLEDVEILNGITEIQNTAIENNNIVTDTNTKVTDSSADIEALVTSQNSMSDKISRILGLTQQNFRISNQNYDANNNLTSSRISIYNSASNANSGVAPIAEYQMNASYDQQGRLTSYIVVEI